MARISSQYVVKLGKRSVKAYTRFMARHHRHILVVVLTVSAILSFLFVYRGYENTISKTYQAELVDSHPISIAGVVISSSGNSELWLIDDQIYVMNYFYFNDSSLALTEVRYVNKSAYFNGGIAWVNPASLESGIYVFTFYSGNVSISTERIFISKFNLLTNQTLVLVTVFSLILWLSVFVFAPVSYLFVMVPARRLLRRTDIPKYKLEIDADKEVDISSTTSRLSERIEYLAGRIDYFWDRRSSLLSTSTVLLTFAAGFPAALYLLGFDMQYVSTTFFFIIWSIAAILAAVFLLHSSTTSSFLPPTSWFYRGRIADERQTKEQFYLDLNRNFHLMTISSEEDNLEDTMTQVVSLYYILQRAGEKYNQARLLIVTGTSMLAIGFLLFVSNIITPVWIVQISFAVIFFIGAIYEITFPFVLWYREQMKTIMLTLYYCPSKLDATIPENSNFESVLADPDSRLGIILTCKMNEDSRSELHDKLFNESQQNMKDHGNLSWIDFGPTDKKYEKFAKEIAVIEIMEHGKQEGFYIYPCKDKDGNLITISEGIQRHL